ARRYPSRVLELAAEPSDHTGDAALSDRADALRRAIDGADTATAVDEYERAAVTAAAAGAKRLVLAVEPAERRHEELAERLGLRLQRVLLQLRRSLPLDEHAAIDVRAFVPGQDERVWLDVNNRAFAWHPDQGGWTLEDLERTMAEPWFDPQGFLLHEQDGRMAGSGWTKGHADTEPPLGEIFVIAVDPDFHGRGLGRQLALAGLDWLAGRGLTVAMLYVEADNEPARRLYEQIGFTTHHEKRWWARDLAEG